MLPDGTKITFHSVSRGKPDGQGINGYPMFKHDAVNNDGIPRRSWVWLRDQAPSGLRKHMPDWLLRTTFRGIARVQEFELRFLVQDSLQNRPWRIGIADDDGWETDFNYSIWNPGSSALPGGTAEPGQLTQLPRHFR